MPLTVTRCYNRRPEEANIIHVLPMASGECSTINCNVRFLLKTTFLIGINENEADCHQFRIVSFLKLTILEISIQ